MGKNLDKGLQAMYSGNLSEAEEFLSKAIDEEPANPDAYFYRGKVRWQSGSLSSAINDFNQVLEINPLHNQAKVSIEMVKKILSFRNPDLHNP